MPCRSKERLPSQQVRSLEAHLGIRLFDRLPKGLSFTPVGRSYHQQMTNAFADLRSATGVLQPEPDKVVVSVTPTFAAKWLIPNLSEFSAAHPDIDLRVLATKKVSSFHGDGVDLAVRLGQPPFGASLDVTRVFRQEIIAVASPQLLEGYGLPLDAASLSRLPRLHDAHDFWPAFFKSLAIEGRVGHGLRLSQTALVIDAALSGQGVALVSRCMVARDLAAGSLLQVTPQIIQAKQDFYLLAQRNARRSAATDAVLRWLVSKAERGA